MRFRSMAARFVAIFGLAITAACDDFELPDLSFGGGEQSLALLGGSVIAAGPSGYCVDSRASDPANGFAAMANCASLGSGDTVPRSLAFLTLQIGEDGSAFDVSEDELRDVMQSADAFSEVGSPDFSVDQDNTAALVIYRRSGETNPIQARAFFDIGQRSAVLTLNEVSGAPLNFNTANQLMIETLRQLRSVNATNADQNG